MSLQQINLYQQQDSAKGFQLNTATIIVAVAAMAILLTVLALLQNAEHNQLADELAALDRQNSELSQRLETLRQQMPTDQGDTLEARHRQLQQKLMQLQQVHNLMARQQKARAISFAAQLSSLSQHHLPGISLAQIKLLNGGRYVELQGSARPAESVPQYLQKLQHDEQFDRAKFGPLQLQRSKQQGDLVHFQLGDTAETNQ